MNKPEELLWDTPSFKVNNTVWGVMPYTKHLPMAVPMIDDRLGQELDFALWMEISAQVSNKVRNVSGHCIREYVQEK